MWPRGAAALGVRNRKPKTLYDDFTAFQIRRDVFACRNIGDVWSDVPDDGQRPVFRNGRQCRSRRWPFPGRPGVALFGIFSFRSCSACIGAAPASVPYRDIEVSFPEESDPAGALCVRTPTGDFDLLAGQPELWEVGRFFMGCAEDANDSGVKTRNP